MVNGPKDAGLDWDAVDWRAAEDEVRRLRQRIFAATRAGDHKRVRSLQKLMLRSRSNTLVSVRQVTQRNAGRFTAGVDGQVALTSQAKAQLVAAIQRSPREVRPVRRVWIPKAKCDVRSHEMSDCTERRIGLEMGADPFQGPADQAARAGGCW